MLRGPSVRLRSPLALSSPTSAPSPLEFAVFYTKTVFMSCGLSETRAGVGFMSV